MRGWGWGREVGCGRAEGGGGGGWGWGSTTRAVADGVVVWGRRGVLLPIDHSLTPIAENLDSPGIEPGQQKCRRPNVSTRNGCPPHAACARSCGLSFGFNTYTHTLRVGKVRAVDRRGLVLGRNLREGVQGVHRVGKGGRGHETGRARGGPGAAGWARAGRGRGSELSPSPTFFL